MAGLQSLRGSSSSSGGLGYGGKCGRNSSRVEIPAYGFGCRVWKNP